MKAETPKSFANFVGFRVRPNTSKCLGAQRITKKNGGWCSGWDSRACYEKIEGIQVEQGDVLGYVARGIAPHAFSNLGVRVGNPIATGRRLQTATHHTHNAISERDVWLAAAGGEDRGSIILATSIRTRKPSAAEPRHRNHSCCPQPQ